MLRLTKSTESEVFIAFDSEGRKVGEIPVIEIENLKYERRIVKGFIKRVRVLWTSFKNANQVF